MSINVFVLCLVRFPGGPRRQTEALQTLHCGLLRQLRCFQVRLHTSALFPPSGPVQFTLFVTRLSKNGTKTTGWLFVLLWWTEFIDSSLWCKKRNKEQILPQTRRFYNVLHVLYRSNGSGDDPFLFRRSCVEHEGYFRVFLSARLPGASGARPSGAEISGVIFRRIKNHGGPERCW